MTLTVLDLFSGIGGFSLGLERTGGFKTVAFCEREPYCKKVLAKHWPDVPIFDDVRGDEVKSVSADVVCGGFPCQPFSAAGKQAGAEDDRYLWPAMLEVIEAVRPRWVVAENVRGIVRMALDTVLSDLEAADYACWACIVPAAGVGAMHRRERVWIVANADGSRDHKDTGPNTNYEKAAKKGRLAGAAGGSLNPTWVEWLMGYPTGWTDLT